MGALSWLAATAAFAGDLEAAQRFALKNLGIAREDNNPVVTANMLSNLGWNAILRGDYAEAKRYCQESLDIFAQSGTEANRAILLVNLGHATAGLGEETE